MSHYLKLFAILLVLTLVLDLGWIGVIAKGFYDRELGGMARRKDGRLAPLIAPVVLVYLLMPLGVLGFVLPRVTGVPLSSGVAWGAAFGCIMYGVYSLTNYSLLAGWSLKMVVADTLWGSFLCGTLAAALAWLDRTIP